jgi:hypothetical protein
MEIIVASTDQAWLEALAKGGGSPVYRRVAQIVLLYAEGLTTNVISERVGLSRSRTRFWRRRYSTLGMAMFSGETVQADSPGSEVQAEGTTSQARTQAVLQEAREAVVPAGPGHCRDNSGMVTPLSSAESRRASARSGADPVRQHPIVSPVGRKSAPSSGNGGADPLSRGDP